MSDPSAPSFLSYAPVSLGFGTSGLRGLVKDITDLEAYINVKAALRYLLAAGDIKAPSVVVLAGDLRPSSDRIMAAAARAIRDAGCSVENAGKIPTPALVFHASSSQRAGVMVSGSHIPFDRNGIKLSKSAGEVLKSDEAGITSEVVRVRAEEYAKTAASSLFDAHGMLKAKEALPAVDPAAERRYIERYTGAFAKGGLSGLRVVVYQHSAVGRDLLAGVLTDLGAEVVTAGRTETFVPIDTENITDDELARMEALVVEAEKGGKRVDAIVSTDGDSDRPLMVAVLAAASKPRLKFLPGDLLGIVVAEYLGATSVAVPISANDAVERRMQEDGVSLVKTRIGSPYVIASMQEIAERAAKGSAASTKIVGWEANGGFLTGSTLRASAGNVEPLPTRDAVLPILANLYAAKEHGGLAALWGKLPSRFGRAGLLDDIPVSAGRAVLSYFAIPEGAKRMSDGQSIDLREGGGSLGDKIAQAFTAEDGFDRAVRLNALDGARITFANGDVAHVRPSGNAPQLRIYSNSDSQERADRIVALALAEPDGILRRLIALASGAAKS